MKSLYFFVIAFFALIGTGIAESLPIVGDPVNFSIRTEINDQPLIHGIVIDGTQRVLFRAIGTSLDQFSVDTLVNDPCLILYNSKGEEIAQSIPVASLSETELETLIIATEQTGAFSLSANSKEAVMIYPISGAATLHAQSISGNKGELLIETYILPDSLNDENLTLSGSPSRQFNPIIALAPAIDQDSPIFPNGIEDSFEILNAELADDCLSVELQYSGGCEEHDFELYFDTSFLERNPPQANIYLRHDGHDDPCDALPITNRIFNIEPLFEVFRNKYPNAADALTIRINTRIDSVNTYHSSLAVE